MSNHDIAELIADNLAMLPHPGKPETNESARLIPLAAFRTTGLAPEMREHVANTALCVGEAIVHLIERDGSVIVNAGELADLKRAENLPGDVMPVICTVCRQPIALLRIVNGRALAAPRALANANYSCPHRMAEEAQPDPAMEATS